jgi:hypothetical protein
MLIQRLIVSERTKANDNVSNRTLRTVLPHIAKVTSLARERGERERECVMFTRKVRVLEEDEQAEIENAKNDAL